MNRVNYMSPEWRTMGAVLDVVIGKNIILFWSPSGTQIAPPTDKINQTFSEWLQIALGIFHCYSKRMDWNCRQSNPGDSFTWWSYNGICHRLTTITIQFHLHSIQSIDIVLCFKLIKNSPKICLFCCMLCFKVASKKTPSPSSFRAFR